MQINLMLLFVFYWLLIFSCLGYGILITRLLKEKNNIINLGYVGLIGILSLIIYSYLSNFFYPHTQIHNLILILLGLVLFIFNLIKESYKKRKIINLLIIFLILFISFIIFKPHDDFSYYHFQYSHHLTQYPLIIGIGQFNHGYATQSSIFYLNSLFFLPLIKYSFFHISVLLVFGFSNLILIEKLFNYLKKNKPNYLSFYLLLSFSFINIIFYRLAEHGTDRSAQILVFLLVFELILLINNRKNFNNAITRIFILLSLIISFKAFYILYFLFLLIVIYYGYKKFNLNFLFLLFQNKFFWFLAITFALVVTTNFFNSGCLLFPVKFTCFYDMPWSFSYNHVVHMGNWYEQWSKAGAGPNFRVENVEEYLIFFNWFSNWIEQYFFNKVHDFLLGLLLIIFVFFLFFCSLKIKKKISTDIIFPIYLFLIILFLEWIYNHPALRYGGFVLIGLLLFIPSSFLFEKFSKENIINRIKIIFVIIIVIFTFRNILRINNEIKKYNFNPLINAHYRFDQKYLQIHKEIEYLINNYISCSKYEKCDENADIKVGKRFGKFYFINEQ